MTDAAPYVAGMEKPSPDVEERLQRLGQRTVISDKVLSERLRLRADDDHTDSEISVARELHAG